MRRLLTRLFHLPEEHRRKAVLLFGGLMCVAAAGLSARTVGDTLFLVRYGAAWICYMYIATALVVTGAAMWIRRLGRRLPVPSLMTGFVLSLAAIGLGFRAGLAAGISWLAIPVYLWADLVATLVVVQFWGLAGSAFNAREAKRLFAFIGSGGTLAGALFGLLIRQYIGWMGPHNLLVVVALLLVGFAALLRLAVRAGVSAAGPAGGPGRAARRPTPARSPQVRAIGAMAVVAALALTLIDFQFKADARAHYPSAVALASFFGVFYACNSVASMLLQAFLVGRILRHGGLLVSLMILPAVLLAGSIGILGSSAFPAIVATKFAHVLLFFTIDNTVFQILYLSLPAQGRGQAKTFVDGICRPAALGAAGLLLILVVPFMTVPSVSVLVLPLLGAWIALVAVNFRGYMAALMATLKQGRFDLSGEADLSDKASAQVLKRLMAEGTDDEVVYVFELIDEMPQVDWAPQAMAALERKAPRIQVLALNHLRGLDRRVAIPFLEEFLRHPDPAVRASAAGVADPSVDREIANALEALLTDPVAEVRAEAAASLLRSAVSKAFDPAWSALRQMAVSEDPAVRAQAARGLELAGEGPRGPRHPSAGLGIPGTPGQAEARRILISLLRDGIPAVRVAALRAAARIPCPEGIPAMVDMLADDATRPAASDALIAYGDGGLEALKHAVTPDAWGQVGRAAVRVPAVLGRIGSRAAFEDLRVLLRGRSDDLRHAAIDAVCQVMRERPALSLSPQDLEDLTLAEAGRAMVLQNLLSDMRLLPGSDLLVQTLAEMRGDCVRRVFILLGVRFPRADMAAIQRAVTEGAGEVRANALEVLDNTLKGELRERLIGGLLEPKPGLRPDMEDALERLRGLMDWPDEWLKACAIHTAGRGGIATVLPEVASAAESQEGLVRETALWAIGRIPATAGGGTADRV